MRKHVLSLLIVMSFAVSCAGNTEQETAPDSATVGEEPASVLPAATNTAPAAVVLPGTSTAESVVDSPALAAEPLISDLPIIGPAPSWANEVWINSDPLYLEELRGKVVLLEFWTFG